MPRLTKKVPKPKGDKPPLPGEEPQLTAPAEGGMEAPEPATTTATMEMETPPPTPPAPVEAEPAAEGQPKEPKPRPDKKPRRERAEKPEAAATGEPNGAPLLAVNIAKLQAMSMGDLNHMAKDLGIENFGTMRKHEVIFHILQKNAERSGVLFSEGVMEVLTDVFGFLRSQSFNYLPCPEDIYVSPSQIRRFDLQTGNLVAGQIRPP